MKKVILVELLLVPGKYILHFRQKVLLQNKMFQITSGNDVWPYFLDFNFSELGFFGSKFPYCVVASFCSKFGPVQDVRIPCQQKRMFGFVTFVFAETVKQILAKGNPHFVCGARVLVKPYREKSRLVDR